MLSGQRHEIYLRSSFVGSSRSFPIIENETQSLMVSQFVCQQAPLTYQHRVLLTLSTVFSGNLSLLGKQGCIPAAARPRHTDSCLLCSPARATVIGGQRAGGAKKPRWPRACSGGAVRTLPQAGTHLATRRVVSASSRKKQQASGYRWDLGQRRREKFWRQNKGRNDYTVQSQHLGRCCDHKRGRFLDQQQPRLSKKVKFMGMQGGRVGQRAGGHLP